MKYDHIFDSEEIVYGRYLDKVKIDSENDIPVNILFTKENIVLTADCHGKVVFSDLDGNIIKTDKADVDRKFDRVHIRVTESRILAQFNITKWIDHYPNCDGEYDRWSEIIVDTITFSCP